jgi:hypothetical protein
MTNCNFFKPGHIFIPSNEINAHQQTTGITAAKPWCNHPKHSPVSEIDVTGFGGQHLLRCGGKMENCMLTNEQLTDI